MKEKFFFYFGPTGRDLGHDRSPGHDPIFIFGS
jgi:hypothetical protein